MQIDRQTIIGQLIEGGVLERDGCGLFVCAGLSSEVIAACEAIAQRAAEEEREALKPALDAYDKMRDHIGGCTDGGCVVKKPKGMHTNGGCKCPTDRITATRMMQAGTALADAIRALSANKENQG